MILAAQMSEHMGDVVVSTLALSVAAGAVLMVLAKKLNIPGIVFLLIGGVLLGPEGLGFVQPETLGSTLNVMVAVAVGLILFEGGLTLDVAGYRSAPRVIRNLLTVGGVVTWVGVAALIWLLFPVELEFAVLAASLVIVTGPTVVQPILKRSTSHTTNNCKLTPMLITTKKLARKKHARTSSLFKRVAAVTSCLPPCRYTTVYPENAYLSRI